MRPPRSRFPAPSRSCARSSRGPRRVPSVEEELARRLASGEEVVLATVVKLDGEPPSQAGAKLLMSRDASLAGTLGCSEFDSAALTDSASIAGSTSTRTTTRRTSWRRWRRCCLASLASSAWLGAAATPATTSRHCGPRACPKR
ncbi:MAG: XdhC family protein [Chloroflexi bacterium]|nr:MAG: XdhC family protein [Chloroflexota bacterium]